MALGVGNPLAQGVVSPSGLVAACQLDPVVVNQSALAVVNPLAQGAANLSVLVEADHSTIQEA